MGFMDAEEPSRPKVFRLQLLGYRLRATAGQRKLDRLSELVPNDDGLVYGPTRAEIGIVCLGTLVASPLFAIAAGLVVWITNASGHPFVSSLPHGFPSLVATLMIAFVLRLLFRYRGPRPLTAVRTRLFRHEEEGAFLVMYLLLETALLLAWLFH